MITNLTLQNFKCFRNVGVSPKLVTVLIGPNGTGKSSVLQALCLLKQWESSDGLIPLDGPFVQLSPDEFMHTSDSGVQILPVVTLSLSGRWTAASRVIQSPVDFDLDFIFDRVGNTISKRSNARFRFDGNDIYIPDKSSESDLISFTGNPPGIGYFLETPGVYIGELEPISSRWNAHTSAVDGVLATSYHLLNKLRVVPAIRGLSRRTYPLGSQLHSEILSDQGLSAQEDAIATTLAYSEPEMIRVSNWMIQVTGVGVRAGIVPPQMIKPVSVTSSIQPSLLAEGSGTNALVHLLFELARARNGATILVEEPEIHLHPGAQAELASVIAGEAKASNKQVIMTTHSEHIAGRLMIEVAEGNLSPEDIAIYSFEKDDNGVCSASEIEVSANGQVAGGLRSFFQTDLDEMRRYVDALRAKA
jgi:energy-coupling factor transporter ATP-binding protein EcfA2